MKKKNVLYILGAGSSVDFGFPLANEIFWSADNEVARLPKAYNDFDSEHLVDLEKVLKKSVFIVNKIYTNLPNNFREYPSFEEILQFIYDSRSKDIQKGLWVDSYFSPHSSIRAFEILVELLYGTLISKTNALIHNNKHVKYKEFIKSMDFQEENITFISLNYDTILDSILTECINEDLVDVLDYGFEKVSKNKNLNRKSRKVALYKPHGSINFWASKYSKDEFFIYDQCFDSIQRRRKLDFRPIIIPPVPVKKMFVKERDVESFLGPKRVAYRRIKDEHRDSLARFREKLEANIKDVLKVVDEIKVIGYSCPAYDTDFKGLLVDGLLLNKNRKKIPISIIDKEMGSLVTLKSKFIHLAGEVRIIGRNGFGKFLSRAN